jgi:hypothetical protein
MTRSVTPRFSILTQALAVVFVITGLGAALSGLSTRGADRIILLALATPFVLVGTGIWIEDLRAWWAGLIICAISVLASLIARLGQGWIPWLAFLTMFFVSAKQGRSDQAAKTHQN